MTRFIAQLVFSISVENEGRKNQYEEKLVWLRAADYASAYAKAVDMGRDSEIRFTNDNNHQMCWRFIGITYLSMADTATGDFELFSEIRELCEIKASVILQRADSINRRYKNIMIK